MTEKTETTKLTLANFISVFGYLYGFCLLGFCFVYYQSPAAIFTWLIAAVLVTPVFRDELVNNPLRRKYNVEISPSFAWPLAILLHMMGSALVSI